MPVEFHTRSAFSFLEGASLPEELVLRAAELGYEGIAVTDRDGFFGSARAHSMARAVGIRALVGATIRHGTSTVPVLCRTREGYQPLSRFLTSTRLSPDEQVELCPDGHLIALTGDRESEVVRAILRNDLAGATQAVGLLEDRFGRE